MHSIEAVRWAPDGVAVRIVDQRRLPRELVERDLSSVDDIVDAIATLSVRGAPAIGVTAAYGIAMRGRELALGKRKEFAASLRAEAARIAAARPTAVNLRWAVDRMLRLVNESASPSAVADALRAEADAIREEDRRMCERIGEHAADLLQDGMAVLTHCNTGALATAGMGTALAALYVAHERGMHLRVFASETRPLFQGSRLTAWELSRAGIPVTVVTEGAVASLMRRKLIDCVLLGADRIAANGDVANKIGTYSHAVAARAHALPFYVAAPSSTVDLATSSGDSIEIEERAGDEVLAAVGLREREDGVWARNPAFDVTPAELITAIVTEQGVYRPPYVLGPRAD